MCKSPKPKQVKLSYFAILAEQAGITEEVHTTNAENYAQLYQELTEKYQFSLSLKGIKVAVDREFIDINHPISDGDHIVFIPPVAGG